MVIKYLLVAGISAGVGYYYGRHRLEQNYFERLQEADEAARDFYRNRYKDQAAKNGEDPEVTDAAVDAAEALEKYQGVSVPPVVMTERLTEVVKAEAKLADIEPSAGREYLLDKVEAYVDTVSPTAPEVTDALMEHQSSGPVAYHKISTPEKVEKALEPVVSTPPDIITLEEFVHSKSGYTQFSITYFAGDDVLAGEQDQVIGLEARGVDLGEDVLQKLKIGPKAMNGLDAIYIRNHEKQVEFDITRSKGSYVDEVGPIDQSG